jgi:hypothetical protein
MVSPAKGILGVTITKSIFNDPNTTIVFSISMAAVVQLVGKVQTTIANQIPGLF